MSEPDPTQVFRDIDEDLTTRYVLEGREHSLDEFTGVVEDDGESRTYYEWRVVSMGDEDGIELTTTSGKVHTYSAEYFRMQLDAGRYRPAVEREDGIRVASPENHRVDTDAGTDPGVAESENEEHPFDGDASTVGDEEGELVSGGDAEPPEATGEREETVLGTELDSESAELDDASSGRDGPGAGPGAPTDHDEGAETASSDSSSQEHDIETPGDAAGEAPAGSEAEHEDETGERESEPESADRASSGADVAPDADEGASGSVDRGDAAATESPGDPDTAPRAESAETTAVAGGPESAETDATDATEQTGGAEPPETAEPPENAEGAEVTTSDEEQARREVERLRDIATDSTRHKYVRENAIRELPSHGERGAEVLDEIVDDESMTAEERALASTLLKDVRSGDD
jgi:hypothetical protein